MLQLINIIKGTGNEKNILGKVETFLKEKKIPKSTVCKGTTPLAEAAKCGYTHIIDHLIKKGFNPHEKIKVANLDCTALSLAITHKQFDAAIVLIENMNEFFMCEDGTSFDLGIAIDSNQPILVEEILKKLPNFLTKKTNDNETLLHFALMRKSQDVVSYLLKIMPVEMIFAISKSGFSPYDIALNSAQDTPLISLLDMGASPLNSKRGFPIDMVLRGTGSAEGKFSCVNILLARGAGLNISILPKEVFTMFKLNEKKDGPFSFLLIGEQKQQDGTWKNRPITNFPMLIECIKQSDWGLNDEQHSGEQEPQWRFNKKHLLISMQEPLFSHLPHVQEIQKLLPKQSSYNPPPFDKKSIPHLSISEHHAMINYYYRDLSLESKELNSMAKNFTNDDDEIVLIKKIEKFFEKLSIMLSFINHFNANSHYTPLIISCNMIIALYISINENQMTRKPVFLETVITKISSLIKEHKLHIDSTIHEFILVQKQSFELELAAYYLSAKQESLALISGLNVKRDIDYCKRIFSNFESRNEFIIYQSFLISAVIDVHHGWLKEANQKIEQAIKLCDKLGIDLIKIKDKFLLDSINGIISFLLKNNPSLLGLQILEKLNYICPIQFSNYKQNYIQDIGSIIIEKVLPLKNDILFDCVSSISFPLNEADKKNTTLIRFLKKIPGVTFNTPNEVIFMEEFLLSKNCISKINTLIEIIKPKETSVKRPQFKEKESIEVLTNQLSDLNYPQKKEKKKRKGVADPKRANKVIPIENSTNMNVEENDGFIIPDGYSPPVPIIGNGLPDENGLFLTLPINRPEFLPFLKLIRTDGGKYHPVHSIAEKGYNQQGVKLSKIWIHDSNHIRHKKEIARLKVLGANGNGKLRAWGEAQQVIRDKENRVKKLYVIDTQVNKKDEKNQNYDILPKN